MTIFTIIQLLRAITGNEKIYPLRFPDLVIGEALKVEITSSVGLGAGVQDLSIQLVSKAKHPQNAEALCLEVIGSLQDIPRNYVLGESIQLLLCQCLTPQPFFLGETETGEFLFTADFRLLLNRLISMAEEEQVLEDNLEEKEEETEEE